MSADTTKTGKGGEAPVEDKPTNFVKDLVLADLQAGKHGGRLVTRFPPEPNGYLHVGHAKSVCLNFGLAKLSPEGVCNLRFDDTNPDAESPEYVESIKRDVAWLGFAWGEREYYASDYFEKLYELALQLIDKGLAYVDSQNGEQIRENRGNYHRPGLDSPYRDRTPEENRALFEKMRKGELKEGEAVLRAKIDMAHEDVKLRDPLMYRIRNTAHHRTGTAWKIYPLYDWAHGQSDAIEGVTHSVCTLEFVNHRNLYHWFLDNLDGLPTHPQQIEFGRLNLSFTVLSKRKLNLLVTEGHVDGWDDPRMPTLAGMRRRGIPPAAIRKFCDRIGVSKNDGVVDVTLFEYEIREELNRTAKRCMAVLKPLKIVLENFPEGRVDWIDCPYSPEDESLGTRKVPFTRELYVERDDFMMQPVKKWHRLGPGKEVRLRYAALITCKEVIEKDGEVVELRCHWDDKSERGNAHDGRKVRGTLHWVSAEHAIDATVRQYDRLFTVENPNDIDDEAGETFLKHLNPDSLETVEGAKLEPALAEATTDETVQFERLGYFVLDPSSTGDQRYFNRTIALRDSWAKIAKKLAAGG